MREWSSSYREITDVNDIVVSTSEINIYKIRWMLIVNVYAIIFLGNVAAKSQLKCLPGELVQRSVGTGVNRRSFLIGFHHCASSLCVSPVRHASSFYFIHYSIKILVGLH